ncbi:hypothetical protein L3Y34_010776 [Caenorhabditis briggsae]|nr:hypothetical protein L3Y34_010776 [Caenorhabditis briggsae]
MINHDRLHHESCNSSRAFHRLLGFDFFPPLSFFEVLRWIIIIAIICVSLRLVFHPQSSKEDCIGAQRE